MTGDIAPVVELLARYSPNFAGADFGLVRKWMAEGADMEKDILPVLRHWTSVKADIYSLGFFAPYVRQTRITRLGTPISTESISIHERARQIAFVTRRVGKCKPRET